MQVTNFLNLPKPVVEAVRRDAYDRGDADISVTELLSPPRQVALMRRHHDDLVIDAADQIYGLFGKIGHGLLEAANYEGVSEERLFAPVGGWTVSGRTDSAYMEKTERGNQWILDDYKFTSPWVVKIFQAGGNDAEGSRIHEWFKQLNIYRWLWMKNGRDVVRCRLVLLMAGWSKLEAKRDRAYPQKQIMVVDVPLMNIHDVEAMVVERVKLHQLAQQTLDVDGQPRLVRCTDDETWMRRGRVAVMKEGRKSALRVLDSVDEAGRWCVENGYAVTLITKGDLGKVELKPGISLVERPSEYVRCANYCDVAPFCDQAKETVDGEADS